MTDTRSMHSQGIMLTADKSKKLEWKKIGENYEFVVSEAKQITHDIHTRISFDKTKCNPQTMTESEFLEYLDANTYLSKNQ